MRAAALIIITSIVVSGCGNACQRVCHRMADFAEECGYTVSDADIESCMQDNASVDKDTAKACRQFGNAQQIREEWTCEELDAYFGDE